MEVSKSTHLSSVIRIAIKCRLDVNSRLCGFLCSLLMCINVRIFQNGAAFQVIMKEQDSCISLRDDQRETVWMTAETHSSRMQIRQQFHEAITTVFKSKTLINSLLGDRIGLPSNSWCEGLCRKWWSSRWWCITKDKWNKNPTKGNVLWVVVVFWFNSVIHDTFRYVIASCFWA